MGAGEDAEVTTIQPSVNSSRVNNSVQFSDLRFMVLFSLYSAFVFPQFSIVGRSLN